MAQKRMFDKSVIGTDDFIEMPDSSQNLYFHLSMSADDDGFVDSWKSIMRMTGKKEDDFKILVAKKFVLPFETGVIVIRHWKINNYLRKDRHSETKYTKELKMLSEEENGTYNLENKGVKPLVYQMATNGVPSIEENRIEKNRIEKRGGFKKPCVSEIKNYCSERKNKVDAEAFFDFYESKDWFVGKNKMKDWKASVRTWEKRNTTNKVEEKLPDWFDKEVKQSKGKNVKELLKDFK